MADQKEYDAICAGIATWDTIFTGVDPDFLRMDGMTAEGYYASSGGDAVNAAVSMGRLGTKTAVCACIGNDSAAELVKEDLRKAGVSADYLTVREDLHTASPVLLVDESGERHILRVPKNANHYFTKEMVPEELLVKSRHLHFASANVMPGIDGKPLGELFAKAHDLGLTTSMDVSYDKAGKWLENIEDALANCDVLIPSYQEAKMYAKSDRIDDIMDFFSKYPLSVFGIKLGEDGVVVTNFAETWRIPTLFHGTPVDTTGAGDAFLSGFVSAWLEGFDVPSCAAIGSAQSALVLRKVGANTGAGDTDQIVEILEENHIKLHKAEG